MILDEPTVGLDVESRHGLWDVIRSYRERDAAVLLTTHYMEEAETLCDRIGIIQEGRLIAIDTIANLRASIGHEYKLVYETTEGRQTVYGNDESSLAAQVRAEGVDEYAVMRTTLGRRLPGADAGNPRKDRRRWRELTRSTPEAHESLSATPSRCWNSMRCQ